MDFREFVSAVTCKREEVDRFLDPKAAKWAQFDSELGYTLHDSVMQDGVDGALSIYHYEPTSERLRVNYANRPCRINTYGDSFTQCHQVSNGETWQEYLAAHFGEPIRNYGVGGYGVYQAWKRLQRHEATEQAAEYILFNIFPDDHYRSLDAWRMIRLQPPEIARQVASLMFHANPWDHLEFNPATGQFSEKPSLCPTPESLYNLTDSEWIFETFKTDFVAQATYTQHTGLVDAGELLAAHAKAFGLAGEWGAPEDNKRLVQEILTLEALKATEVILGWMRDWAEAQERKLLVILSHDFGNVLCALKGQRRWDQPLVDFLTKTGWPFWDSMGAHISDFADFRITPEEYIRRYYIGHYNPTGNHFFAFALKDVLLEWLEPAPPTYQTESGSWQQLVAELAPDSRSAKQVN